MVMKEGEYDGLVSLDTFAPSTSLVEILIVTVKFRFRL